MATRGRSGGIVQSGLPNSPKSSKAWCDVRGTVFRWAVVVVILGTVGTTRAADPLAAKIDAIIDGKDYVQAHWGLLVVDTKTGEVVYARNPDKLFAPASVTKLYSCAAALIAYGPDYRFDTHVYRHGDVSRSGTLDGDLILVASGDPSFGGRTTREGRLAYKDDDHTYANGGSGDTELTDTDPLAALDELAKQIRAEGIQYVSGDVVIDDRLFEPTRGTGSGPDAVSPINVNDNVVDLIVTPGAKAGDPATVRMRPVTALFSLDAQVVTAGKDVKADLHLDAVGTSIVVRGTVPATGKPQVRIFPIDDPATYARGLFVEALRRQGVRVAAPVARSNPTQLIPARGSSELPKIAAYTSPPMSELVKVTLKVSHNLYASELPCLVAVKAGHRTLEDGLKEQGKILKSLGVDIGTISFGGGAGGAHADKVTPRATVTLLRAMALRPEWTAYQAGMPILGVDGTLAKVVPTNSPARGKAHAKTGTLVWRDALNGRSILTSKALAGVMTTKSGRALTFALFVNDVPLPPDTPTRREGKVLGSLCEIVYEHCP